MREHPNRSTYQSSIRLPFGISELDPEVQFVQQEPRSVRCFVRGCPRVLRTPTRKDRFRGDVCPEHHIRCHASFAGATYSYASVQRNIIASPSLVRERIVHHPFKYESHRLGQERSEDAVSWNVFRSLLEAGRLADFAAVVTGEYIPHQPQLYLWGILVSDDSCEPWDLLIAARRRFESNLPVQRPLTEPDIALHLPGRYLILIEAKFTSPNTYYERGDRKDGHSLTLDELLAIYSDESLSLLDMRRATAAPRVAYQLWRNVVFAEWMALTDHSRTKAYHVNLVRAGCEADAETEFRRLVRDDHQDRFRRMTWEAIYGQFREDPRLRLLRRYFETKTAGLLPAFSLSDLSS